MKDTFINCARGLTVAVIGDIMLDVYVDGTVERLNPEAPNCIVLDEQGRRFALGGAANVAHNLASWGVKTKLCGVIGGTDHCLSRVRLKSRLDNLKRDFQFEMHDIGSIYRPCTVKTRFLSAGQQLLRVDTEVKSPVRPVKEVIDGLIATLSCVDAVILSDYGKGVLSNEVLDVVFDTVAGRNDSAGLWMPILVDPKRTRLSDYIRTSHIGRASVICPNAKEWAASEECRANDAKFLGAVPHIIVTDGAKGCFEVGWDDDLRCWLKRYHAPAVPTAVCDPSGAGDTFIAALTVALMGTERAQLIKKEITEACDIANKIAALTVSEHGIVVPELDSVEEALRVPPAVPA